MADERDPATKVAPASGEALSELHLARRLFLVILFPVALLVAASGVLAFQISSMADASQWLDHTDLVIGRSYDLQKQIIDQETGIRGFLLTEDPVYLEPFEKARVEERIEELVGLVADNPAHRAKLGEVRRRYLEWVAEMRAIAERKMSMEVARAPARMALRKRNMDGVRSVINDLLVSEEQLRQQRFAAQAAATRTTIYTAVPLFIALIGTLVFGTRRQIVSVVTIYRDVISNERRNRGVLEAQAWMRTCQNKLAASLLGDLGVDELAARTLAEIVPAVGADAAAFYVADTDGYRRRAAIALDPSAPELFRSGEGLVGAAALSKELVHRKDLPDDFMTIRAGTGERRPSELVIVPALADGVPIAVVELAFLGKAPERGLELLERISESIAVAVRSAEYRLRLRDYLEESQRQGEELQTQQEELRVANEELTEQRDALRSAHAMLGERKEELEASNAGLESQRDELQRAQRALYDQTVELERASRYKSEFLANMSHELRTPLNSSLILAKLLGENRTGNLSEEQVRFADTIYSAGNDLLALINDILDLSKIEAGKLDVSPVRVSGEQLVEPIGRTFEPIARNKSLELRIEVGPGIEVETDPQRVQQILKNLLSNACKFTEKGSVSLSITRAGDRVTFAVRDTGIGIAPEHQGTIFEAFRQADGTTNRRFGGTGLGLSISRDLAHLLGGELTVESEPGKGSAFLLVLPVAYAGPVQTSSPPPPGIAPRSDARPAGQSAPPRPRSPAPGTSAGVTINGAASAEAAASDVARSVPPPAFPDDRGIVDRSRRLLLVVEDDVAFARVLADLGHELEFHCIVAHGADDGVRLAVQYVPDAVVLDMQLPDHSGLSVLDRLKRNPVTRHIPVHIVSARDETHAALSMGAVGYMLKPVDRDQLKSALSKLSEKFVSMRRLLVVEDDAAQREGIARLLEGPTVDIVAVATVAEALREVGGGTFDCVVTDLTLPDGSGYDLLEKMAVDQSKGFPPVIVYTGRSLTADEEQRLRKYSSSIIVKGVRSPERLVDEVTLFLHQVESELPPERRRMLEKARDREASFDGRTILIAEDDVRNVFALSSVLEPRGAKVVIARNGKEAIDLLEKTPEVAMVLMDIMMPEMDGITAMKSIRSRGGAWAKLPIIALTAKAMRDDQERCMQAGANDFIAKPLDVEMLLSLVRVWMPR